MNTEFSLLRSKVFLKGIEVFGSKNAFIAWTLKPHATFDGQFPLHSAYDVKGLTLIDEELENIARGDLS